MAASSSARKGSPKPRTAFRRVSVLVMLLGAAVLGCCSWAVFAPQTIPYDTLGPLGTSTKYVLENYNTQFKIWYFIIWLIHAGEALYSFKLCKAKGITDGVTQFLWFAQTFVFGIPSLNSLRAYKPLGKSQ